MRPESHLSFRPPGWHARFNAMRFQFGHLTISETRKSRVLKATYQHNVLEEK